MTTGKVVKLTSNPPGFLVHVPTPAPDGTDVAFVDVSSDQLAVASAAYIKGSDVDVSGTPPACSNVDAK